MFYISFVLIIYVFTLPKKIIKEKYPEEEEVSVIYF